MEAIVGAGILHDQHPVGQDGVSAERQFARRLAGLQPDLGLEPLAMAVDKRDVGDGYLKEFGRQAGDPVEAILGPSIEKFQRAQLLQPRPRLPQGGTQRRVGQPAKHTVRPVVDASHGLAEAGDKLVAVQVQGGPARRHQVGQRQDQPHAAILHALAPGADHGRQVRQPTLHRHQGGAALVHQVGQRQLQSLGAVVQPLPRGAEQGGQVGQAALGARQAQAVVLCHAVQAADQPRRLVLQVGHHVGPRRHRQFGGGGGCGRTPVGNEVDQRGVGLVADRGDQRDAAGGGGTDDDLLVERHQVFQAATAPRHDQHVRPRHATARRHCAETGIRRHCAGTGISRQGVEAGDGGGDTFCRALALHRDGPEQ